MLIKCAHSTCINNKGSCVTISAGAYVSFRCNQMGRRLTKNPNKTLCDHGQINIALQQVWPWTCYFLWGWTEQLGMNGIITHTHTEAPLQVHMGIQADRSKQIQTEKYILPNKTPRKYMQRHTQSWAVGIWNKSGKEKSWKEDNPLSLYCEFLQSNRKALTEIFDFVGGKKVK